MLISFLRVGSEIFASNDAGSQERREGAGCSEEEDGRRFLDILSAFGIGFMHEDLVLLWFAGESRESSV